MRIKSLTVLLAGLMGGALMGIAQPRTHVEYRLSHTTKDIVTQYMDSLTRFRAHQDSMDIAGFVLIPYLYIHFTSTKVVETANRTKKNTKFFHIPGYEDHQPPHFHINYQHQSPFHFIRQSH